ncbi:MAG: ATP-binding protein [Chloroflexi bacterium]|nr:ATP-binding protein [Chloroflexota bacterium]MBU1750427.1 ATP-binding protein [Chloroflexota bacterium]
MINSKARNPYSIETYLPPEQKIIETSTVKQFKALMSMIAGSSMEDQPDVWPIIGAPGIGKTVAIQSYLDSLQPGLSVGQSSSSIAITARPRTTPYSLVGAIVGSFQDEPYNPPRKSTAKALTKAVKAIALHKLEILIIDRADYLYKDSFELLLHICEMAGCPIVAVGLPRMRQLLARHREFAKQGECLTSLQSLGLEEISAIVLPGLTIPLWSFNCQDGTDRAMGERIWKMVSPSMRRLRNLLQLASQIAEAYDAPRITNDIITEAFQWSATQEERRRFAQGSKPQACPAKPTRRVGT